jgi:hypothetical protein
MAAPSRAARNVNSAKVEEALLQCDPKGRAGAEPGNWFRVLWRATGEIRACKSFSELHSLFHSLLVKIFGVNELYVYDAAQRMGAFLGLKPKQVYLHAGVRKGTTALGLDVKGRPWVEMDNLPRALRGVSADHLENFLCIYRKHFRPGMQ